MISPKYIFILGAKDPEMNRIAQILAEQNAAYFWATRNGQPVSPLDAYDADAPEIDVKDKKVVLIECRIPGLRAMDTVLIDHHNPGDAGYALGPRKYWSAASLGQLFKILDLPGSHADFVLAAMDHCFNAAVQGRCPDISTEEVMAIHITEIAKSTGQDRKIVEETIAAYMRQIPEFPPEAYGNGTIRHIPYAGTGYSLNYLCALVAAVRAGIPVIIHLRNEEGGLEKLHLCGDVSGAAVEYFKRIYAPSHRLTGVYGNPYRGYAGGYVPRGLRSGLFC